MVQVRADVTFDVNVCKLREWSLAVDPCEDDAVNAVAEVTRLLGDIDEFIRVSSIDHLEVI